MTTVCHHMKCDEYIFLIWQQGSFLTHVSINRSGIAQGRTMGESLGLGSVSIRRALMRMYGGAN